MRAVSHGGIIWGIGASESPMLSWVRSSPGALKECDGPGMRDEPTVAHMRRRPMA